MYNVQFLCYYPWYSMHLICLYLRWAVSQIQLCSLRPATSKVYSGHCFQCKFMQNCVIQFISTCTLFKVVPICYVILKGSYIICIISCSNCLSNLLVVVYLFHCQPFCSLLAFKISKKFLLGTHLLTGSWYSTVYRVVHQCQLFLSL